MKNQGSPLYMKFGNRQFARVDTMTMDKDFNITLKFPNGFEKILEPDKYGIEVADGKSKNPETIKIVTRDTDYYPSELIPPLPPEESSP